MRAGQEHRQFHLVERRRGSFLGHAREVKRLGAAVIVMAFDEKGQADTYERKIEVCERAYRLLVDEVGSIPMTSYSTLTCWP